MENDLSSAEMNRLLADIQHWLDTGRRLGGERATDEWVEDSFRVVLAHVQHLVDINDSLRVSSSPRTKSSG